MKKNNLFLLFFTLLAFVFSSTKAFSSWIYDENKYIVQNAESENPAYAKESTPVAYYGDEYFSTIEAAVKSANNSGSEQNVYVIPGTNPTIQSDITINSNVNLYFPYDSSNNYKESSVSQKFAKNSDTIADNNASSFRKNLVTLEANKKITLNGGNLYLGGILGMSKSNSNQRPATGHTVAEYCEIKMKSGSQIIVNSDSRLDIRGFIKEDYSVSYDRREGNGSNIYVNGGNIVQPFVVYDHKGGGNASGVVGKNLFPFKMYDTPNVNCKIVFENSGKMTGYMILSGDNRLREIEVLGSNGLVKPSSTSYIERKFTSGNGEKTVCYDTNTTVDVLCKGAVSIGSMTILVYSTEDCFLFIPYQYKYKLKGATLNVDAKVAFLTGSSIIADSDSVVNINNEAILLQSFEDKERSSSNGYGWPYPSTFKNVPCECICNGTVNINNKFGGTITSNVTGAKIITGSNFRSRISIPIGYKAGNSASYVQTQVLQEQFKLRMMYNGVVQETYSEVGAGSYLSFTDENKLTGWYSSSGVIFYNTNGSTDSYPDKDITIGMSGYTLTTEDISYLPSKNYYTFGGWYMDSEFQTLATTSTTLYAGTTLYAKWNLINYNIYYHFDTMANGNPTDGTETNDENNPSTFNYESILTLYPAAYGNHVFDGWYMDSEFTQKVSSITGDILDSLSSPYNLNLYGRWYSENTETYTITYHNENTDSGCTCIESEEVISDNLNVYTPPSLSGKNNNIEYNKHFIGWYIDEEFNTPYTSYEQITSSINLYAKWVNKNSINLGVVIEGSVNMLSTYYLSKDVQFTVPNLSDKVPNMQPSIGYYFGWLVTGGNYNGQVLTAGDKVILSSSWNESIDVVCDEYPETKTLTLTVGEHITCTVFVNGNQKASITNSSTTINVKTGDQVSVSTSREDSYTDGGEMTFNDGFDVVTEGSVYTVNGTMDPAINVADAEESSSCFLADTPILLEDGTTKLAKDITVNDRIVTFNHLSGEFEAQNIAFNVVEEGIYDVIELTFDDGNVMKVATGHGLFNLTRNRYEIYYGTEFSQHIGEEFVEVVNNNGKFETKNVKLVDVNVKKEYTQKYSPISCYNINLVGDNMLTIPDDIEGMFDMYTYDENLKVDQDAFGELVNQYGLWTYDDFKEYAPERAFEIMNFQYIKIALYGGYMSIDKVNHLLEKYLPMIVEQNNLEWDCENQKYITELR